MFLRNHDELTLDKLSEEERHEVFRAFGPREDMQIYGRGLRRRLPTMLGGDLRRVKMHGGPHPDAVVGGRRLQPDGAGTRSPRAPSPPTG
ncbi:hypothetical protein [Nonomuraea sp. 10N515B]|uniref:hypothetical protein n=1 Tax=Nonomuraea sp. 10N515B TaxID=3457422 RepID=UPI003FCD3255